MRIHYKEILSNVHRDKFYNVRNNKTLVDFFILLDVIIIMFDDFY